MNFDDFYNSEWMKAGRTREGEQKVRSEYSSWKRYVGSVGIVDKAARLWHHLNSPECSAMQKAVIVAALLYIISPIDAVPDFIPIAGWLDDLGVAAMVLGFLNTQTSETHGSC